jgi:tRNA-splicing ligase RtcB
MKKITDKLISSASILEDNTEAQARTASSMPFVYPQLALRPDAHLGRGATVGSVIPTLRAVMPAAVGVDIGCGMIAVRTELTRSDIGAQAAAVEPLRSLRQSIERAVPTSAGASNRKIVATAEPRIADLETRAEKAQFDPATYAGNVPVAVDAGQPVTQRMRDRHRGGQRARAAE